MIDVFETLVRLRDKRKADNLIPDYVPYAELANDIMSQVREELNRLYADKKISVKTTLNSKSIEIL